MGAKIWGKSLFEPVGKQAKTEGRLQTKSSEKNHL